MRNFLLSLLSLTIFGCAPKPIVVEPVAPVAKRATAAAEKSTTSAARVVTAADAAVTSSQKLGFQLSVALADFDKQRTNPEIPKEVAEMNFQTMTRLAAGMVQVERDNKQVRTEAVTSHEAAVETKTATAETERAAVKGDKVTEEIASENIKLGKDAAMGRALKAFFWGGVIIGVLWLGLKLARKFKFLP